MTTTEASNSTEKFQSYTHPDMIVDCDWVEAHRNDPNVCIIESNEDVLLYDVGHIEGSVHIDWRTDLQDDLVRDYVSPSQFAEICSKNGITPDTTCVFYGDKSNWWACYALWAFRLFGHQNVKIMDGGRSKWLLEGRDMTRTRTERTRSEYPVPSQRKDSEIRAFFDETLAHSSEKKPLVDVRSPGEFKGEVTHMPDYPQEGVLRGGRVPNAQSCPWSRAANEDGTFKTRAELEAIYQQELSLKPEEDLIVYCRIGERSSHTWFVLSFLLGFKNVRNYDGSWTEWGNRVRSPIEKG